MKIGDLVKDRLGNIGIVLCVSEPTVRLPYQVISVSFMGSDNGYCRLPTDGILSTDVEVVNEMS